MIRQEGRNIGSAGGEVRNDAINGKSLAAIRARNAVVRNVARLYAIPRDRAQSVDAINNSFQEANLGYGFSSRGIIADRREVVRNGATNGKSLAVIRVRERGRQRRRQIICDSARSRGTIRSDKNSFPDSNRG